jgi:2'-5' RNA ligase
LETNERQIHTSPPGKIRKPKLFVGLALGPDTQARIAQVAQQLRDRGLNARYESTEKYHVTAAFLGWIDPSLTEPIRVAMQAVSKRMQPFNLRFDMVGGFPDDHRPRVVFLGSHEQSAQFRELADTLRAAYQTLGFTFKDAPVAHITLARIKENRAPIPAVPEFAPIEVPVGVLTLFDSIHEKETTRYERLFSNPIGI